MAESAVICLGEMLIDELADQPGKRLEQVESWTAQPGGAPANVACALVKLGTSAAFIGCVGQDALGDRLVELLRSVGVDDCGVQRSAQPTRRVYVLRSETGDRTFAGFSDPDPAAFADTQLLAEQIPTTLFAHAQFLVLGTLGLAYPETRRSIERAIALAKQHGMKIFVDVNWRSMFWLDPDAALSLVRGVVNQADFLKLTDVEAEWLLGNTDPATIAVSLGAVQGVMVTAGDRGSAYWFQGTAGTVPAFSVPVQDTTGAGDAFTAGILHQLVQRGLERLHEPEVAREIVRFASAVGALAVMQQGAIVAQPTLTKVIGFLNSFNQTDLP